MALEQKVASLIGFAAKSGRLLLGNHAVEQGIKRKQAKLVLAASDMNPKRRDILRLWCQDMEIPFLATGTKEGYGAMLQRPPLGLLALTDKHMAQGIIDAAKTNGGG